MRVKVTKTVLDVKLYAMQVGKRFQQPAAGAPKQYERAEYMLDRLGLSVSFLCLVCAAAVLLSLCVVL